MELKWSYSLNINSVRIVAKTNHNAIDITLKMSLTRRPAGAIKLTEHAYAFQRWAGVPRNFDW